MMAGKFEHILSRYGRDVTVYNEAVPEGTAVRAFVQPMREKGTEQSVPSPLGRVEQDRFLYLGPPETALDHTCRVAVQGEVYRVETAQPIYVGGVVSHWWAVLTHRAKEAVE